MVSPSSPHPSSLCAVGVSQLKENREQIKQVSSLQKQRAACWFGGSAPPGWQMHSEKLETGQILQEVINAARGRLNILSPIQPETSTYFGNHLSTRLPFSRFFFPSTIIPIDWCFQARLDCFFFFFLILFPTSYRHRKSKLLAAIQLTYLATPPSCFQFRIKSWTPSVCSSVQAAILPEVPDKFHCICSQSGCVLISFCLTIHLQLWGIIYLDPLYAMRWSLYVICHSASPKSRFAPLKPSSAERDLLVFTND